MASIQMRNLKSFPMEKLCFDLKLEALEPMGPWDVYELAKVNQGFQGMLVRDPSIVFGEHVSHIHFIDETIWIEKFSNSNRMELNVDRLFSHFSFMKKIRSCDLLWFQTNHQFNEIYTLLKNLKSVNDLYLRWISKETLERFFSNFHASIKEVVLDIGSSAFNDQVIKDWIENFMVGPQLKDCEKIWFGRISKDSVRFCYNAFLKAEIKNVAMHTSSGCINLLIQQIVTNGIPSKNPEGAFFLESYDFMIDLSQYPGMRRIDGENRLRLLKQANDLVRNCGYSGSRGFGRKLNVFTEENLMFRQRFDSGKDCIYVYKDYIDAYWYECTYFVAFYVSVD